MSWYRAGSVTVAAGSNVVTGAGTDFVANVAVGDAFIGQDGRSYEVQQVVSATELRLATTYQAATGGGQVYGILPTRSSINDLVLLAGALLGSFGAVRDGVGQGLFGDGSAASPGIRFAADQDTGFRRSSDNRGALVAGGVDRLFWTSTGVGIGTSTPMVPLDLGTGTGAKFQVFSDGAVRCGMGVDMAPGAFGTSIFTNSAIAFGRYDGSAWTDYGRFDSGGNLLVGVISGTAHRIEKSGLPEGGLVLGIAAGAGSAITAEFRRVNASPFNGGAPAALMLGHNTTNNRSATTSGTVNASGADYAEYMVKSDGCGLIAKGDVCGVDRDGKLTKSWADAVSFVVKSTDPSLVGGDTWAAHLPPKPELPGAEPIAPVMPTPPTGEPDEPASEAYTMAMAQYVKDAEAYIATATRWKEEVAAYDRDLPAWEAQQEAARQCVDRIAFCGQVPCNVTGDFAVGDYIIPVQDGDGIKAVAVKDDDSLTDRQYRRRIGKVWAIRGGRAWIDVQHG